jgi:hypothetical protein
VYPGVKIGGSVAYRTQKLFPLGDTVTVHYDPKNPARSLLKVTTSHITWIWLVLIIGNFILCWIAFPDPFNKVALRLLVWAASVFRTYLLKPRSFCGQLHTSQLLPALDLQHRPLVGYHPLAGLP